MPGLSFDPYPPCPLLVSVRVINLGGAARRLRSSQAAVLGSAQPLFAIRKTSDRIKRFRVAGSLVPRNFPPLPNIEIGEPWKIPPTRAGVRPAMTAQRFITSRFVYRKGVQRFAANLGLVEGPPPSGFGLGDSVLGAGAAITPPTGVCP